jgi:hypothetical protein
MLVGGAALIAWQGWVYFSAEAPPPIPTVSADTIAGIQITLGQAALTLRDFGANGLLTDRFQFEQGIARVRQSVEALEGSALESEERQALGRAKATLDRLVDIEKEHIIRVDARRNAMASQTLAEIPRLRDEAASALTDFREAGVRRSSTTAESDSLTRLLLGSAGAGVGLLSLCIGAVALWSRLFST